MNGITFERADCMEKLPSFPDKFFDLAIVDPPYGTGADYFERFGGRFDKYKRPAEEWKPIERRGGRHDKKYGRKIISWDIAPDEGYFKELFRVSKAQIIWGGNYFPLPPNRCFIVWRKTNIPAVGFTMAPVEYAWASFNENACIIEANSGGTVNNQRFHPTQKPIALYEELLYRYAKKGYKILDTHVGSGSSLIACYRGGVSSVGL